MSGLKSQTVTSSSAIPAERIERHILLIREHKVMLDADLAELYEVETKELNLAVRRNFERFPEDFMFQLSEEEFRNLRFHSETSRSWGGRRYRPYAFIEQGVAMLSTVLRSSRAVQVNVAIMRAFVKLRGMLSSHRELARKFDEMESRYDAQLKVFEAVRESHPTKRPLERRLAGTALERRI